VRRAVVGILVTHLVVALLGRMVSRRLHRGDETSEEFQVAAIGGGRQLRSRARGLRSGSAVAVMGGVQLDLTGADLIPQGAALDLLAVMGGVEVRVPPTWTVAVVDSSVAGGVAVAVSAAEDLPRGSPRLAVRARAVMGGIRVAAASR
jgi:hypothetical protein